MRQFWDLETRIDRQKIGRMDVNVLKDILFALEDLYLHSLHHMFLVHQFRSFVQIITIQFPQLPCFAQCDHHAVILSLIGKHQTGVF